MKNKKNFFFNWIFSLFPIFYWIPKYNWKKNLKGDISAGITCGITV